MTNITKFKELVSNEKTGTYEKVKERIRNRAMLRESQKIAMLVLLKLDDLKWSQKRLAQELGVSPQFINKIVSGKENLTLETQIKIQDILNIPILASYYREMEKNAVSEMSSGVNYATITPSKQVETNYSGAKVISLQIKINQDPFYKSAY